ncbi:MAG: hypothetical protein QJR07_11355 [Acetobacteraceae bacterium]|nr:hypothetical protein [Acetobacteraceae bacterium]
MATHDHTTADPGGDPQCLPSRRALLAAAAALPVAGIPAARTAVSPDAELLRLCAEMDEVRAVMDPLEIEYNDTRVSDPRYRELAELLREPTARWRALFDQVAQTPARTLGGMQAKAKVLRKQWNFWADGSPMHEDPHDEMVWGLLNDLLAAGSAGGAA